MTTHESPDSERDHFDHLAFERRAHGFIPDLRQMADNDFFYLSPYRRQRLAQLSLTRISNFATEQLRKVLPHGGRVLDLGCGNGWFSLELARAGFDVTGVDLSPGNIEIAREAAHQADLSPGNGRISYLAADLYSWDPLVSGYDAACFNGTLHHLPSYQAVLHRCLEWLVPEGHIVSIEPMPNNYGEAEAILALAIRLALSSSGTWYEKLPLPVNDTALGTMIEDVRGEYFNWADKSESANQSPNNNSTDGTEILEFLRGLLDTVAEAPVIPIQHRLIGGIRLPDEASTIRFAETWIWMEERLVKAGFLRAGGFLYCGRAKPRS